MPSCCEGELRGSDPPDARCCRFALLPELNPLRYRVSWCPPLPWSPEGDGHNEDPASYWVSGRFSSGDELEPVSDSTLRRLDELGGIGHALLLLSSVELDAPPESVRTSPDPLAARLAGSRPCLLLAAHPDRCS